MPTKFGGCNHLGYRQLVDIQDQGQAQQNDAEQRGDAQRMDSETRHLFPLAPGHRTGHLLAFHELGNQ
ncbi:MAG: hypothetical protein LC637_08815 [Xanthomonadaceae bacterium]|nr:hypothetical protein [Xanthomonadaceae bacterium]